MSGLLKHNNTKEKDDLHLTVNSELHQSFMFLKFSQILQRLILHIHYYAKLAEINATQTLLCEFYTNVTMIIHQLLCEMNATQTLLCEFYTNFTMIIHQLLTEMKATQTLLCEFYTNVTMIIHHLILIQHRWSVFLYLWQQCAKWQ